MTNGGQRRSPLFAGLLLILLGTLFLIERFYPHFGLGHLIRLYWPVLIILWGVAKLIDHMSAQRSGEPHGPLLSGAEAVLLILLALVLATFVFRDWIHDEFPGIEIHLPAFGHSFSRTQDLPAVEIPAGAHVTVETAHGDIKITGVDGNYVRVGVRSSTTGGSQSAADQKLRAANAVIDRTADGYRIHSIDQNNWGSPATIAFNVQVPTTATVTANTSHGDVSVEKVAGSIEARTLSGDIRIQNAGSDLNAETQKGDIHISGVRGNAQVRGNGEDLEITTVTGDATIDGAFLGDTSVRKIAGTLRIKSPRADVTAVQLAGELALDSGDLSISGALGPVKITTHDKDVTIKGVTSRVDITDSHGDVDVRFSKPPTDDVSVTNESGDVELTLPAQSAFEISAVSRSGEVECDFEDPSIRLARETENERLNGRFGTPSGGPVSRISIATSYGTIRVNKSK